MTIKNRVEMLLKVCLCRAIDETVDRSIEQLQTNAFYNSFYALFTLHDIQEFAYVADISLAISREQEAGLQ